MNIEKFHRADVLAALYNAIGMPGHLGALHYDPEPMTKEQAEALLQRQNRGTDRISFDYVKGRSLKVEFFRNDVDLVLYDRDHGVGAGESAILKACKPKLR